MLKKNGKRHTQIQPSYCVGYEDIANACLAKTSHILRKTSANFIRIVKFLGGVHIVNRQTGGKTEK